MLVRLLGPFVATLGQPTTLCWRLERGGPPAPAGGGAGSGAAQQAPAGAPASRIAFEVLTEVSCSGPGREKSQSLVCACRCTSTTNSHVPRTCLAAQLPRLPSPPPQSDAWRPLGRRFGSVTLAGHPGAVATVEATWVPLASGSLPVPLLSLQASSELRAVWLQQTAVYCLAGGRFAERLDRRWTSLEVLRAWQGALELVPTDILTCS